MDDRSSLELPPDLRAPALARRHLRHVGQDWAPTLLHTVLLATSELVTNAVRHGTGDVTLITTVTAQTIRIEVHDGSDTPLPDPGHSGPRVAGSSDGGGPTQEGGRGLQIVAALASRWGVVPSARQAGKAVWFELRATSGLH